MSGGMAGADGAAPRQASAPAAIASAAAANADCGLRIAEITEIAGFSRFQWLGFADLITLAICSSVANHTPGFDFM